jgi:hypothetical protein
LSFGVDLDDVNCLVILVIILRLGIIPYNSIKKSVSGLGRQLPTVKSVQPGAVLCAVHHNALYNCDIFG